ncbi:GlxA family transcriptional regulator [Sphingopyxis sp. SE2]|jgi:transcriptional regulator GlxA family with amidase domain|uniref:GlxA family transcriptional regulator n=1 Tax=unclassified Sphingopyxis TaxID=2614943 RepID=UPI00050F540C|nr:MULTISPECIES: GlxA family transcriptional regulator [unclassified Sphingopyxis]KGB58255.1 Transcriptional regulator, AraC family [Sphingopyxis sp. LC363]MDT7527545.1 GlxA family transcriptional regulator [Sphingopyxis sp. SE2]
MPRLKVPDAPPALVEVGMMLYPDCQIGMVHGITDLFDVAGRFAIDHGRRPIRASHWRLQERGGFARCFDSHPDEPASNSPAVLIAPGSLHKLLEPDEVAPYARWLVDRHAQGTVLASNCGGAFALAATGLLAGRPATTHWFFAEEFRMRFPEVRLEADRMVVDDGDIVTAGGLMAWTDLGLRIVERLLGPTVMMETARFFLIDPAGREQKNYASFAPRLTHGDEAVLKVQHWLQAKEGRVSGVGDMAREAGLEERTFQRRFKAATGMTPVEYVQHIRVGKARELLEFTRRTVDQIAWSVGYEDAAAFRKLFHRLTGLSPGEYRQRFSTPQSLAEVA